MRSRYNVVSWLLLILALPAWPQDAWCQPETTAAWVEMRFDDAAIYRRVVGPVGCGPLFPPSADHWSVNLHKPCGSGPHEITASDGGQPYTITAPTDPQRWFLTYEIDHTGEWSAPCPYEGSGYFRGVWLWCNDGLGTFGCEEFGAWSIQFREPGRDPEWPDGVDDPQHYFTPGYSLVDVLPIHVLDGVLQGTDASLDLSLLVSLNTVAIVTVTDGNDLVLWIGDPMRRGGDWNCSGHTDVDDVSGYLVAWFAWAERTDWDQNGLCDVPDVFSFLTEWFANN